jgi:hypothetical protein
MCGVVECTDVMTLFKKPSPYTEGLLRFAPPGGGLESIEGSPLSYIDDPLDVPFTPAVTIQGQGVERRPQG